MKESDILTKLGDDRDYYGDFGRRFLSNSDIKALLKDPRLFRKATTPTTAMLMGSYLHTKILEPQRLREFALVDAGSRSTNAYKSALGDGEILLLRKEAEELDFLCDCITQNLTFCDMIYREGNEYEKPGLTPIKGVMWKGKADIVSGDGIIDLKTTANIDDFYWSAKRYNYDSQAFLYQTIFGVPMKFLVVEKKSGRTALFDCSQQFLSAGEDKVYRAMEIYERFFGENATEDVTQFFIYSQL